MLGPKTTPTDKELTNPAFKLHVYEEITNIELCTQITQILFLVSKKLCFVLLTKFM